MGDQEKPPALAVGSNHTLKISLVTCFPALAIAPPIFLSRIQKRAQGRLEDLFLRGRELLCSNEIIDLFEDRRVQGERYRFVLTRHLHGINRILTSVQMSIRVLTLQDTKCYPQTL